MEEKKEQLQYWEIPEIDLNLRHYSGHPSDVIKKIKSDIEIYLSNPEVSLYNRKIYSAVYYALNYYRDISYLPSAEYGTGDTFLSSTIRSFNEDYEYLSQKYNSSDPATPPVISYNGRIKSPLSFVEKVKEKITEYLNDGKDLGYFNESLRDLIGMRVVIDPPEEIKAQGLQAESDFLYKVFYDLMTHRGLTGTNESNETHYKFIPINTRHDPQKADKLKNRSKKEGYNKDIEASKIKFFIPERRIPEMEQECVDSVVKDYNLYPKFSGYQSLHICITPDYSENIEHLVAPSYIIPPKCLDYSFEYQFRTKTQDDFAEHGPASHKSSYKPNGPYHRLAVPFYITFDTPEVLTEDSYEPGKKLKKPLNYENKLRLRNFGESFKKFYGFTFKSYFGITFKKFRDTFGSQDRNDILSRKKIVVYDEENDLYTAQAVDSSTSSPIVVSLKRDEIENLKNILSANDVQRLSTFIEQHYLKDAIIQVTEDSFETDIFTKTSSSGFQIYSLESSEDRSQINQQITTPSSKKTVSSTPTKKASIQTGKGLDDD